MESADTTEVVLLNGLYPSTMRTATAGFESALQHQLDSTTGSAIDSASTAEHQQHQLKNQLQRFAKIPSSVAQTHTRMAPIKVGMGRVDKRKLVSVISSTPFKTATPLGTSPGLSTATATITITDIDNDEDESDSEPRLDRPTNSVQSNSKSRNRNSNSSSTTKHGNHADDSDSDDESEGKTSVMAPREGFTVAYSLFARAKARILHNNNPSQNQRQPKPQQQQQQPQPQQQQPQQQQQRHLHPAGRHPNEKSNDSNGESGASKLSSSEESDSSNACTLPGSDDVLSVGNDSDGTVTDLDGSTNCLRQSKFSFASRPSTPDDTAACTSKAPLVDSTPTVTVTAEVIADDIDDVAETDNLDDDGRDPIERFEEILGRQHHSEEAITASLHELRQMILAYGIPDQPELDARTPSIRGRCWKLLLEVHHVSAQEYVSLVKRGKPEEYGKIRNDTFRTLATDQKYLDAVKEDSLIRVLCAFAWSNQATRPQDSEVFTYVQGMNVLAAPILYTMSEMEAFYAYSNLIKYCCPLYVQPTLQGVHCGIKLLERCLDKIDPELYKYLKSKSMSAELYALPPILTICACTPPLSQVMQLWDFLLAWGIHLNILCIIAQLYLIRGELMAHASPMKLLRILPDLDADKIIRETMRMVKLLPDDLYDLLVRHPYDPTVAEQIDW